MDKKGKLRIIFLIVGFFCIFYSFFSFSFVFSTYYGEPCSLNELSFDTCNTMNNKACIATCTSAGDAFKQCFETCGGCETKKAYYSFYAGTSEDTSRYALSLDCQGNATEIGPDLDGNVIGCIELDTSLVVTSSGYKNQTYLNNFFPLYNVTSSRSYNLVNVWDLVKTKTFEKTNWGYCTEYFNAGNRCNLSTQCGSDICKGTCQCDIDEGYELCGSDENYLKGVIDKSDEPVCWKEDMEKSQCDICQPEYFRLYEENLSYYDDRGNVVSCDVRGNPWWMNAEQYNCTDWFPPTGQCGFNDNHSRICSVDIVNYPQYSECNFFLQQAYIFGREANALLYPWCYFPDKEIPRQNKSCTESTTWGGPSSIRPENLCIGGVGDGILDEGEDCDEGDDNQDPEDGSCNPGDHGGICSWCDWDCTLHFNFSEHFCGDGIIDEGYEDCDEGIYNYDMYAGGYGYGYGYDPEGCTPLIDNPCIWCDTNCIETSIAGSSMEVYCFDNDGDSQGRSLLNYSSFNLTLLDEKWLLFTSGKCKDCNDFNNSIYFGSGNEVGNCNDLKDNDCDGLIDCADNDCPPCIVPEECVNPWQNLNGDFLISSNINDTIILNSSQSQIMPLRDRVYSIYEKDLLFDDFIGNYSESDRPYLEYVLPYFDDLGGLGEFILHLFSSSNPSIKESCSPNLEVSEDEDNTVPFVKIESINGNSSLVSKDELKIAPNFTLILAASAYDEDDFLNVFWTIDGKEIGKIDHFAKIFNSSEILNLTYNLLGESAGNHEICIVAKEERREKSNLSCFTFNVPCEGICVSAVISSPVDGADHDTFNVLFNATGSHVDNCSNVSNGQDSITDLGDWYCSPIHKPNSNPSEQFTINPNLGIKYNLSVIWIIDGKPEEELFWNSNHDGEKSQIFHIFFPSKGWHDVTLQVIYEGLV